MSAGIEILKYSRVFSPSNHFRF